MSTVVHRRESCPGSCPRVCTRGRSAGITQRTYHGTGFVRSLDLDQFHVLHYFFFVPFPCLLRPLQIAFFRPTVR